MSLARVLDVLYRWRWLTFTPFVVILVVFGDLSSRRDEPLAWLALGLLAGLVWLPIGIRWMRSAGQARRAFREGLEGG